MASSADGASRCGGWTAPLWWQAIGGKPSHSERADDARSLQQVGLDLLDHIEDIAVDTAAVREARSDRADHVAMAVCEEVMAEKALRALPHLGQQSTGDQEAGIAVGIREGVHVPSEVFDRLRVVGGVRDQVGLVERLPAIRGTATSASCSRYCTNGKPQIQAASSCPESSRSVISW